MGKRMKKNSKMGDDVAVTEVSPSIGVRTRAKTIALQNSDSACIQLRSRCVRKNPPARRSDFCAMSLGFSSADQNLEPSYDENPFDLGGRDRVMSGNKRRRFAPNEANTAYQIVHAMTELASATTKLINEIHQSHSGNTRGNPQFLAFMEISPPSFEGDYNPILAEEWLQKMEKIFRIMRCTDEQKVDYATFMLQGKADDWWKGAQEGMDAKEISVTWENFKTAFLDRYFPTCVRNQKEAEFLRLEQGDMSVGQYVAKFEELSKFSLSLRHHPNTDWKAIKFEQGLKAEIRNMVIAFEIRDYFTLVNKCMIIEQNLSEVEADKQIFWKRNREEARFTKNTMQGVGGVKMEGCRKCGKSHMGVCLMGQNVCFRCQKPGHIARDCPLTKKMVATNPKPQTKGRVFTISGEKA